MKKNLLFVIASVSLMLIFAGCAKLPQAEIDAAKAAIEEVRAAQADIYLPGEFSAINDSLRVAMEKVEAQKGKLFKSYKKVKLQLVNIPTMAATIKANTETKKAEKLWKRSKRNSASLTVPSQMYPTCSPTVTSWALSIK